MTLTTSLIRLLSHLSRRRHWQLAGLLVLMLVGALAEMATLGAVVPFLALLADPSMASKYPWLQTVLGWFGATQSNVLLAAGILFSLIALAAAAIRMLMMWSSMRFSYGLGADLGSEVYCRTLYQPYSWHVSHNTSEILSAIDQVNSVVGGVLTPLLQGVVALVMSGGVLIMLLVIDTPTALIAGIGFLVLYGITSLLVHRPLVKNSKVISSTVTQKIQAVQEGLGGIRDVLLDGTQPIFQRRFATLDYAMRRAQASNAVIGASPRYVIEAAGMVLIVVLAFWLSPRDGGLNSAIPVLGALAMGAQKLLPNMQLVYSSWSSMSGARNQLADVLTLLDRPIPPEYLSPSFGAATLGVKPLAASEARQDANHHSHSPQIALHNVSFRYQPDAPEVLHGINLEIPPGARIGFIGKTGSGKSTLIDLIMGLLEPTAGHIEIDGQPLTLSNRRAWQRRIAHVPQAIYLSDASIAENIAFGIPTAQIDMTIIKSIAAIAQLAEFVERLPQQYQTPVGERGVRLSGGQRQRIGIARALYKQASVIIFDEATSALDNETEEAVMSAIDRLDRSLTIILIAHRLSTLSQCDAIYEVKGHAATQVRLVERAKGATQKSSIVSLNQ